jgi:hypothetical protein
VHRFRRSELVALNVATSGSCPRASKLSCGEARAVKARWAAPKPAQRAVPKTNRHVKPTAAGALPDAERKILIATAQHQQGVSREQLTILTGYKRSTRDAYLQRLRSRGLIDDANGSVVATPGGIAALGSGYEPLPTGSALRDHWLQRLPSGESAVLRVLVEAYPTPVDREHISEATVFKRSTRGTRPVYRVDAVVSVSS